MPGRRGRSSPLPVNARTFVSVGSPWSRVRGASWFGRERSTFRFPPSRSKRSCGVSPIESKPRPLDGYRGTHHRSGRPSLPSPAITGVGTQRTGTGGDSCGGRWLRNPGSGIRAVCVPSTNNRTIPVMAIDFASDGSVIIEWGSRNIVIPSPMIGDYRKLRNRLDELARIEDDLREKGQATLADKTGKDAKDRAKREQG